MNNKLLKGFTFIELIIYITLVSIFVTSAVYFSIDIRTGKEKSKSLEMVQNTARMLMARISYEIAFATDVNSVSATQLSLKKSTPSIDPTILTFSGTTITIQRGAGAVTPLSSNQVIVSNGLFTNLQTTNLSSKNIQVSFDVAQTQSGNAVDYQATTSAKTSVELTGNFNSARKFLVDATNAILIQGKKLQGITIQNIDTVGSTVTLDKMIVSWTGGSAGVKVKSIVIGGVTVWSGNGASGDLLDVTNVALVGGNPATPVDLIDFSGNMIGVVMTTTYILTDGSSVVHVITF